MDFKLVKKGTYIITDNVEQIISEVDDIISKILSIDKGNYYDGVNLTLFEDILSRYVADSFIKQYEDVFSTEQHIVITMTINNRNYNITIGTIVIDTQMKYLNGIIEV